LQPYRFAGCTSALPQSPEEEPKSLAILEFGAAASWSFTEGRSSIAPTAAVEVRPIEKWLELEAGVTPVFHRHSTEWDVDFLFKKPWTVSNKIEFMAGFGPEWNHLRQGGATTNSVAAEGFSILCFGHGKSGASDGISNQAMNMGLGQTMNGRLA
jgi:hypothetical protein